MDGRDFIQLLNGFVAEPVDDVFLEYQSKSRPYWFHLLCSIYDFNLIWSSKDFKFYSLCRCHQVTDEGLIVHEHIHAIISSRVVLQTWKQRLYRRNIKLTKTTFKKILCGDHLAGVLRYLCCESGLKTKIRGSKRVVPIPHTHYERRVDQKNWLHSRGKICDKIREDIESKMKLKTNLPLHDYETCECDRGKIGITNRKEANRKRRAFYDSEKGLDWKERWKKKKTAKEEIINKLQDINHVNNESLRKELARLINLL
jgi:hypothetical protein